MAHKPTSDPSDDGPRALVLDYLGLHVVVLRGYADYNDAQADRLTLDAAGLDGRVLLGVGMDTRWVLLVPVGEQRRARQAFMAAARDRRSVPPMRRAPAPSMPAADDELPETEGERPDWEPPKWPARGLARSRGEALHRYLGAVGVADHYAAASAALGRRLTSLASLSADECEAVRQHVEAQPSASSTMRAAA